MYSRYTYYAQMIVIIAYPMNVDALSSALGILPTSNAVKVVVCAPEAEQYEGEFRSSGKRERQKRYPTVCQASCVRT